MRSRFRFVFWLTATVAGATLGISLLAAFTGNGSEALKRLAGRATIAAVLVLLINLAMAWAARRASSEAELAPEPVESQLRWMLEHEAVTKHSLVSDSAGGNRPVNLRFRKVTSSSEDCSGGVTNDLESVAEYFKSLSQERMVVLGGPGSGKTVLALELQTQLLELCRQNQADPLPVLVEAASYDPGWKWAISLAVHLAERYSLPEQATVRLVLDGRILPIIDGVDELERAAAGALITEVNEFIRERESSPDRDRAPVVVTCRQAEYQDLVEPLDGATHIEVQPLTTEDVKKYLQGSKIEIPDQLASVLTSPLMLSLADAAYGPGPISAKSIDDLLHIPDETAMERRLLSVFLDNVYRTRRSRNWPQAQAERWLAMIGGQLRRLSTEGYGWRQVAYAMPAGLLGLLTAAVTCLGLLVTFSALGIAHQVFGDRMPLAPAIGYLITASIVPAVIAALLVLARVNPRSPAFLAFSDGLTGPSLIFELVMDIVFSSGPSRALRQELQSELLRQRQGKSNCPASPRADLGQSRSQALIRATGFGGTLGILAAALALTGVHVPRDATIVFVCYCMVVTTLCTPWGSFQLARAWLSARGELPLRLLKFLSDAHERGVFRSAGPQFEFRNETLREYFTDPARLPEVRREIDSLTAWVLGNLEIRESYRHVGANKADIKQAISSLATETILAGQPLVGDASTRQAALERVRVRLNEVGRRSAFDKFLVAREAPGLGTVIDPSRIILTRTMDDLARLIDRIPSASVGISGIRGIGKSTLIRWLCTERNTSRRFPALGIYVTAPVEYDARDFLIHLYITLCKAVLDDDRLTGHSIRTRLRKFSWRVALAIVLATAGIGFYDHRVIDRTVAAQWAYHQGDLWSAGTSVLFTAALVILISAIRGMRQRPGGGRKKTSLEAAARARLQHLRYQVVETTGQTGNLKGPFGLSFSGSRSRQVTENQMTLPELVESYREFAELTVSALQEFARRKDPTAGAQVRLVVGIDEIDRIEDAMSAEKFLNDVKAIFGISNCFYVASLSADALANFERRVVSTRTAFDTTFDTVMRIGPLELGTAREVLELRAIGLPYLFITLCYMLSGGVPRELMRIARGIFDVRNDVRFGSADEGVACAVIAPQVIQREMGSLRQGLMPLATQLNVPGAADLIGLLDDSDWPSGHMRDDLAKLTEITGQRALFQDEAGNIAAAAKICDGLAAAYYFFFSVNELFGTRLDQIITDLKNYDTTPNRGEDSARRIHLLARARAAIGVNPTLAVTRVRAARKDYGLPDVAPVLLSQLHADSTDS